jgi:hypothetical protein
VYYETGFGYIFYCCIDDVFVADANGLVIPAVGSGRDTTLYAGQSLSFVFSTNPAIHYQWQDAAITPTYTIAKSGTYWVRATAGQLSDTDTIRVTIEPLVRLPADTMSLSGRNAHHNSQLSHQTRFSVDR